MGGAAPPFTAVAPPPRRENQAVHTELAALASAHDKEKRASRAAGDQRTGAEQRAAMAEAERKDLLANYRKVRSTAA